MITKRDFLANGFVMAGEFIERSYPNHLLTFKNEILLPNDWGVYAWVFGDEILYIGSSKNVKRRLHNEHIHRPEILPCRPKLRAKLAAGERVHVLVTVGNLLTWGCDENLTARAMEDFLIALVQPIWNIKGLSR